MSELLPDGPIMTLARDLNTICAPMADAFRRDMERLALIWRQLVEESEARGRAGR